MRFSIRGNTCDDSIGELTVEDGSTKLQFDYDREELAHEFINAYRDLFRTNEDWCKHLSHYLDDDDIKAMGFNA